jgi:hypothetical protein
MLIPLISFGQDRFLSYASQDSVGETPRFKGSIGANLKLNGYYDVFGGLQDNETFNVGLIDVFGTDDSQSFKMDMYQSQIKLDAKFIDKKGESITALVEFDFWGGNGHMRLRKAFVESRNWEIGQNWNNFGDEDIWPNIMEWEGPPSGVWIRSPHIKYFNTFKKPSWIYEISLEAPMTDYMTFPELDLEFQETNQVAPDLTFAVKNKYDWGHVRLASILRSIKYKDSIGSDNFIGYGFSLSGIYRTKSKNNVQFQFVGGKGITAYMTSVSGLGFDGYRKNNDRLAATPAFGGWISYEYFFTPRLHSNIVLGFTNYDFRDVQEFLVIDSEEPDTIAVHGDFYNAHYYGIINLMYEPFERMTIGLELNYGGKEIHYDGVVNDLMIDESKSRDAMRISFGFMFYL